MAKGFLRRFQARSLSELIHVSLKTLAAVLPGRRRADRERLTPHLQFDEHFGTDTARKTSLNSLDFPVDLARAGVGYEPSRLGVVTDILALLPINPHDFTFVDIGSGKGLVAIRAARHGFGRVIGLEFSQDLIDIAKNNEKLVSEKTELTSELVFHKGDAAEFDAPPGPLLLYLYNPFGEPVLNAFLDRVEASAKRDPRSIFLAYLNPHWKDLIVRRECWRHFATEPDLEVFELEL
jgi:Methyltransferase domain